MSFRLFFILIILLNVTFFVKADNPPSKELYFDNLTIYGRSNVNDFSFIFENYTDTLPFENIITKQDSQKTEFLFPVNRFITDNKCIQNDFFNMIHADKFHYICFSIDNEQIALLTSGNKCDSINAIITIAQKSKKIWIPLKKHELVNDIFLTGKIDLLLTDFNLTPLSKFFGLIKVENNVVIDFRINLAT